MEPHLPAELPLLGGLPLSRTVAWRGGSPISAGSLLAQAQVLARRLPEAGRPINLCQDRYLFSVALLAGLMRGQTCLLPPNALPATLTLLRHADRVDDAPLQRQQSPQTYALIDDPSLEVDGMVALLVAPLEGLAPLQAEPRVAADLLALCLLTSGSTGAPSPHAKTWGAMQLNIAAGAECLAQALGLPSLSGLSVVATVPPQHSYGLESSVLLALLGGAAMDCGRPFYSADIAATLEALPRPRALVTTPFHLKSLLLSGLALPPVDLIVSATAPLSPQLAAQAEAACGARLVEIYGCTEAGQVAARRTTLGDVWTMLGSIRCEKVSTPAGDSFVVSGGHVSEPTALADVLELLDERHFRLLGRANDLIHVAGKRSSLAHLNFHLNRVEGVDDGVFWLPDEVLEGVVRLVAFVVAPRLSARQLLAALHGRFEPAFMPRRIVHVAALPREATGKLTAQGLRQFALDTLARQGRPSR